MLHLLNCDLLVVPGGDCDRHVMQDLFNFRGGSAEGERIHLNARIEELNVKTSINDRFFLTNKLIKPRSLNDAVALRVNV